MQNNLATLANTAWSELGTAQHQIVIHYAPGMCNVQLKSVKKIVTGYQRPNNTSEMMEYYSI